VPVDQIVTTGMQKQAQVLWAWIEISSPGSSRQELEQRRQAVRLLDVAASSTDISPRDLDSLMARARYYEMAKQYPRALDFLNQAVALQSWVPALIEKAKILIALSDWDQAMEMVQRILQQNERCMEALRLNVLMEMTQRADEQVALAELQLLSKSLDRYEGANAKLFFETARSLSRVSGGRAKILRLLSHFCEKAIKLDPSKAEYVAELAHEKSMLGDYAGAMEMYRDAGRSDETNLAALYGTIYCQVMTGELEDAEQQLEFITAISDSIDQSPQLPYLKALIAWRRSGNAVENINLLVQAERIHFRGLTDRGGTNVFEMFFKLILISSFNLLKSTFNTCGLRIIHLHAVQWVRVRQLML